MKHIGEIGAMVANIIAVMACFVVIFLVVLDINRPTAERDNYGYASSRN